MAAVISRASSKRAVGVFEPARDQVVASPEPQGDGERRERSERARDPHPSGRKLEESLIVPEAARGHTSQAEPPEPSTRIELVGAQRPDRGSERRHTVLIPVREAGDETFEQQIDNGWLCLGGEERTGQVDDTSHLRRPSVDSRLEGREERLTGF